MRRMPAALTSVASPLPVSHTRTRAPLYFFHLRDRDSHGRAIVQKDTGRECRGSGNAEGKHKDDGRQNTAEYIMTCLFLLPSFFLIKIGLIDERRAPQPH